MSHLSRRIVYFFATLLLTTWTVPAAFGQVGAKYPTRPVTIIVPMSAGTSADLGIRILGKQTEKYLGQPIVVVNKAGGGGTIGFSAVATAKPDGYNIGLYTGAAPAFIIPFTEKLPYDTLKDFKFIMQYLNINFGVVVKGDSPFKTFKDVIVYARQNPKKLTYATNAPNSMANLIIEQIAKQEGVQMTHIPFKSSTEYQAALLGNHIQFVAGDFNFPQVEAGETRLLLSFMEKRSEDFPQIPILKDLNYDVPCPVLNGIFAPKDLPNDIAKKLEEAFSKGMKEPAFIKGIRDLRLSPFYRNGQELEEYTARTYEKFGKMLKEMGVVK
jgi:tripartite-type tricarboxylate transporter receptor subunit TctC